MDQLPLEIWSGIIHILWEERYAGKASDSIHNPHYLFNIIRASHMFYNVAIPYLYRHSSITLHPVYMDDRDIAKMTRLIQTILSNPLASSSVRRLKLTTWGFNEDPGDQDEALALLQHIPELLQRMSRLASLTLLTRPSVSDALYVDLPASDDSHALEDQDWARRMLFPLGRLSFRLTSFITDLAYSPLLFQFISSQPHLRVIRWHAVELLHWEEDADIPGLPPRVESMTMSCLLHHPSLDGFVVLLAKTPSVRHISFNEFSWATSQSTVVSTVDVSGALRGLDSFTYYTDGWRGDFFQVKDTLDRMSLSLSRLTYLRLIAWYDFQGDPAHFNDLQQMTQIIRQLPSLKTLVYGPCYMHALYDWVATNPLIPKQVDVYVMVAEKDEEWASSSRKIARLVDHPVNGSWAVRILENFAFPEAPVWGLCRELGYTKLPWDPDRACTED